MIEFTIEKIEVRAKPRTLTKPWTAEIPQEMEVYPDPIKHPEEYKEMNEYLMKTLIKEIDRDKPTE